MGNITVFLDAAGKAIGTCASGHELEWEQEKGGNRRNYASMVSSTDEEWNEHVRRQSKHNRAKCWPRTDIQYETLTYP